MNFRNAIIALSSLALAGCVSMEEIRKEEAERDARRAAQLAEFERTIPECNGEAECRVKWQAAQLWVAQNAGYKLQISTDVLLETYNSTGSSPALAMRVQRVPAGAGKYRIGIQAWCDNWLFGCTTEPINAMLAFNRAIGSVTP